jgi:hypothetical protein
MPTNEMSVIEFSIHRFCYSTGGLIINVAVWLVFCFDLFRRFREGVAIESTHTVLLVVVALFPCDIA